MPRPRGDRVSKIESFFLLTEKGDYECTICNAKIRCQTERGAPGRSRHLAGHTEEWGTVPVAETRAKRPREEKESPEIATKLAEKRKFQVAELFGRNLLPFSLASDEFFEADGVNRKNIIGLMEKAGEALFDKFLQDNKNSYYTMAIDGGTNCNQKTLNICVVVDGIARNIAASRIGSHTTDNIVLEVEKAIGSLADLKPAAITSDNAANVRAATSQLAKRHKCFFTTCGCHCVNLAVKNMLYPTAKMQEAREIVDKVRLADPSCPPEIDSRWLGCYDGMAYVAAHKAAINYDQLLSREEVNLVEESLSIVEPFYHSTRAMEAEQATIFVAITKLHFCLQWLEGHEDFSKFFARNVYTEALVCAAALSPALIPKTLIEPYQRMIHFCLKDAASNFDDDQNTNPKKIRQLLSEWQAYIEGEPQRAFRQTLVASSQGSQPQVPWLGEAPILWSIFERLMNTSASSGSVERSFSAHARAHSWTRAALKETSLNIQLRLHSLLNQAKARSNWSDMLPGALECEKILEWCWPAWVDAHGPQLSVGDKVQVWFADGRENLSAYRCRLVSKDKDNWKVMWATSRESTQPFNPKVDPWIILA